MKPIIGMVPLYDEEKKCLIARKNYADMINMAGGLTIIMQHTDDKEELDQLLDLCDGVLILGGKDVHPSFYGEEVMECCGAIADVSDRYEPVVIRRAVERDMPLMGICRGIQVINVAMGGSLYQDLPEQVSPDCTAHRQSSMGASISAGAPTHEITLVPGSPLHELWKRDSIGVNSHHHQAVKRVAEGFEVMAHAPQGFVEAIYMPAKRYVYGVQWHPEYMVEPEQSEDVRQQQLDMVRCFVKACAEEHARRHGGNER